MFLTGPITCKTSFESVNSCQIISVVIATLDYENKAPFISSGYFVLLVKTYLWSKPNGIMELVVWTYQPYLLGSFVYF
jgi:hypothetical protein